MQLDNWVRSTRKNISAEVQAIRAEIMAMVNETHKEHLPETIEAIKALKRQV